MFGSYSSSGVSVPSTGSTTRRAASTASCWGEQRGVAVDGVAEQTRIGRHRVPCRRRHARTELGATGLSQAGCAPGNTAAAWMDHVPELLGAGEELRARHDRPEELAGPAPAAGVCATSSTPCHRAVSP
jgi:hypothetical protein